MADHFLNELNYNIHKYKERYKNKKHLFILKLVFFLLKSLFIKKKDNTRRVDEILKTQKITKADNCLYINCLLFGGIGDILLSFLYVKKIIEKVDCKYQLHLFIQQSTEAIKYLFKYSGIPFQISNISQSEKYQSDIEIKLDVQFPLIKIFNEKKVRTISKFIPYYYQKLSSFNMFYTDNIKQADKVFLQQAFLHIKDKTRISAMDVGNILGIKDDDTIQLNSPEKDCEILKRYHLNTKKYITLARNCDINNKNPESTRFWPVHYYAELVKLLKIEFPEIPLIQLGYSSDRSKAIPNIDINLVGKTNFSEMLALLKYSSLHIDTEGGYIHLRHFLCREPSVVLFGPTSPQTKGYPENINIRNTNCNCQFCEWLIGDNWQSHCIKSDSPLSSCMASIYPSFVLKEIKKNIIHLNL